MATDEPHTAPKPAEAPMAASAVADAATEAQPVAAALASAPALSKPMGAPPAPAVPKKPSALWNFFFGGNTLVRVGIAVLLVGVAFLLKLAVDAGHDFER